MELLINEQYNELADLKSYIFQNLLSQEYDTKISPTDKISQAQLETMLKTISDILHKRDWHKHHFIQEAIRSIYYLGNPKAKVWMESHYDNKEWLSTFPNLEVQNS